MVKRPTALARIKERIVIHWARLDEDGGVLLLLLLLLRGERRGDASPLLRGDA